MTFGRVTEALSRAIRLVDWPKLVIFFFFIAELVWMVDAHGNVAHALVDVAHLQLG